MQVWGRGQRGPNSDSGGRGLHTAGPEQPVQPRHAPAPTGVRRGTVTTDGHGGTATDQVFDSMSVDTLQ